MHPLPTILLIIVVAYVGARLVRKACEIADRRNYLPSPVATVISARGRWIIVLLAVLTSLQHLGVSMNSVWTALTSIAVLIAIGFIAVWSVLSHASCAAILLLFAPFRIGDEIELSETIGGTNIRGKVKGLNLFHVTLQPENSDDLIQVPNNLFFQKVVRVTRGGKSTTSLKSALLEAHADTDPPGAGPTPTP